jgi:DNA-binding FrmR family transcriptional regulator
MAKSITTEGLAEMIERGFKDMAKQADMDRRFQAVNKRFDAIEGQLERIERLVLVDHKRRIERLEGKMRT